MKALIISMVLAMAAAAPATPPEKTFVRSDQHSHSRAPYNTADVTTLITKEFKGSADADAKKVIAHLEKVKTPFPYFLGRLHASRFIAEPAYRATVTQLAAQVTKGAGVRCMYYLEDEAALRIPATLAQEVQELAKNAVIAVATGCDGRMSREQVQARLKEVHDHYAGTLKIPEYQLFASVTPDKNEQVGTWALEDAYALHFGGFHTMGVQHQDKPTRATTDATYKALDAAWEKLAAAHPEQVFSGLKKKTQ